MPRSFSYTVLDVFAEQPLEGNPLLVFHDARGLTDTEMQALARETRLSETTFVLPADDPAEDARNGLRVRIFTTEEELPFAGHPTLGTAAWWALEHPELAEAADVILQLNVGPIHVRFEAAAALGTDRQGAGRHGTMRQNDPVFGAQFDPAEVAGVLGLTPEHLLPGAVPQSVSTGNAFCIVALHSVAALGELEIPQREATAWLREHGIRWFYVIAPETAAPPHTWRARMQFYGGEDPATGSAAGPCAAWLVRHGYVASETPVTIHQGVEIERRSRLTAQATLRDGRVTEVLVGGRTIPVARGEYFLS